MSFAFSNSVGSAGVILMSKEPWAWTTHLLLCCSTQREDSITAAATANVTLISPPEMQPTEYLVLRSKPHERWR